LKKQKTTLTSLIYNTLYSNNKYNGQEIIPKQLIDTKGIDFFMDDYKENHDITSGMLG
jgi:hypothetical protein